MGSESRKDSLNLVVAWPDWNMRPDRLVMFSRLAGQLERVHLLTARRLQPELAGRLHPGASLVYVGEALSGLDFRRAARQAAAALLGETAGKTKKFVLHDLAIARLLPSPLRKADQSQVRGVVSFYSPTVHGFLSRAWRASGNGRLPLRQELVHWRSALLKIPQEFYAARVADAVTGNSEQICADARRYYRKPAERVFSLPAEVDGSFWAGERFPATKPATVFYCGRLYARKGVFDLLQACQRLNQEGLDFRLVLAGEEALEGGQVALAIAELGLGSLVKVLPHQPSQIIRQLMLSADLFVFPSYFEGSPRAVKEAMAAGCPVVTYDIPGTRFIDPEGEALRLVTPGDISGLAESMRFLLLESAERERLGAAGQKRVRDYFSPEVVADRLMQIYQQLFE